MYPSSEPTIEMNPVAFPLGDDLGEEDWPTSGPPRGVRVRIPTLVLIALLIAVGGLWIGSVLQRGEGSGASSGAGIASALSRFRGLAGASGFRTGAFGGAGGGAGGGFGASSNAVTGTVTVLQGNTLYVTSATGSLIKVSLGSSTTVTRNATVSPSELRPGDTVVVQGAKSANGTVVATSIADSAQGVTSSARSAAAG